MDYPTCPEEWHKQFHKMVRKFAHQQKRLSGTAQSAPLYSLTTEDIEQQLWVMVLPKLRNYDRTRSAPSTFMYRCLTSSCMNMRNLKQFKLQTVPKSTLPSHTDGSTAMGDATGNYWNSFDSVEDRMEREEGNGDEIPFEVLLSQVKDGRVAQVMRAISQGENRSDAAKAVGLTSREALRLMRKAAEEIGLGREYSS